MFTGVPALPFFVLACVSPAIVTEINLQLSIKAMM